MLKRYTFFRLKKLRICANGIILAIIGDDTLRPLGSGLGPLRTHSNFPNIMYVDAICHVMLRRYVVLTWIRGNR